MGICESSFNIQRINKEDKQEDAEYNNNYDKVIPLKNKVNDLKSSNFSQKYTHSNSKESTKKSEKPNLEKYKPSLDKISELSNSNICKSGKSELVSKSNGSELIIKGETNQKCQNKENDIDNPNSMNLVKNNDGVVLNENIDDKRDSNNKKENGILYDFEKDSISDIKSEYSLDENSNGKISLIRALNGKKNENEMKSESSGGKFTNYYLAHDTLKLSKINSYENRSKFTTYTMRPKINLNKYLNGLFSDENNKQNGINIIQNTNNKIIYNTQTLKPMNDFNKNQTCNIYRCQNSSLIANNINKTNDTIKEESSNSLISVPKIDEKIPECFFYMNPNSDEIISILSSH
jgi:hypothetical protein